jgi:DNA polymerase-3 subunit epsilon
VFCALFPRLCAHAATVEEAVAALGARRRARRPAAARRSREERPDLSALPDDPGVYIFRDSRGRPLYIGKSVSLRARARSHFCRPAGWTERAEVVDYRATHSELGALVLENRLIKAHKPPGNVKLKKADGHVYLCARFDISFPVLEVSTTPAAGRAVSVGPLRGRRAAEELVEQLSSLFGLRHCGRSLPRRDHPSAYGQMGRCLSPCLGDLDPNLYRRRLDDALGVFEAADDGRRALLGHVEGRMREAAASRHYEAAAALKRRHEHLQALLGRLGGVLRALHAHSRLVLAPHPTKERADLLWIAAGRVVDWGPLTSLDDAVRRTGDARTRMPARGRRTWVPAEEVDEVRIVSSYLAAHELPELPIDEPADPRTLAAFLGRAAGSSDSRHEAA